LARAISAFNASLDTIDTSFTKTLFHIPDNLS
jgi:hypothetical protein